MAQKKETHILPRTRHINPDGSPKFTNRLNQETSPYLLQHAHNPVDWYPWGDAAFEMAARLKRPVLLSIGYSTCHWCHVMEEESFEDIEIAGVINENYIPVKVDREERPDIDSLYMKAVQSLTGGGGWPMTVWLTPDRRPFYGGTYFPARDNERGNATGFLTLLQKLSHLYHHRSDVVQKAGDQLLDAIRAISRVSKGDTLPGEELLDHAIERFKELFDKTNGGVKGQMKFPSSLPLRLLFRAYRKHSDEVILSMAETTMEKMAYGGINDHVGGGFHRYTTDPHWVIPHFEKMLYDNALLARVYTEAYQLTKKPLYKQVAEQTLDYLIHEMQSPEGGFYSATDADSLTLNGKKEEGYFFTWTEDEMDSLFEPEEAEILKHYYSFKQPREGDRHILHVAQKPESVSKVLKLERDELDKILQKSRKILYQKRSERYAPGLDDKVISGWNGLAVSGFAIAGFVFDENRYLDVARITGNFLINSLITSTGLTRSFKDGKPGHGGFLEDYAFVTAGFLDLFETTGEIKWLMAAMDLDRIQEKDFEDQDQGGFYMTAGHQTDLIQREKPSYDGATPSGNSVAVMNLIRLAGLTGQNSFHQRAQQALILFSNTMKNTPEAIPEMLMALDRFIESNIDVVIVAPEGCKESTRPFLNLLRQRFWPEALLIQAEEGSQKEKASELIPALKNRPAAGDGPVVYICKDSSCRLPIVTTEALEKELASFFQ